eukprot:CAMPEP_0177669184 /NCGR_PEP_ID=MMETSP0447-20121125/23281_1 /TAXON_ID=0 /ORGANISM="Stygamoeba regulata, Strain BSH-02190019" /LENGTH=553 /DNA_ID=CAMNT_0019175985 /DNA_START=190 /DNA_END=1851 /DNA_ORIENTATION=-
MDPSSTLSLLVAVLLVASCSAHNTKLQYHLFSDSIVINTPQGQHSHLPPSPMLFVFPMDATVQDAGNAVSSQGDFSATLFGVPVDNSWSLKWFLSQYGRKEIIFHPETKYELVASIFPAAQKIDFKKLLTDPHVIELSRRYHDNLRKTTREYPHTDEELLADGIEQAIIWAAIFVTHHWGKLHKFPAWKDFNQTGLFHLSTGQQLSHTGQPSGSDDDEVRIALTSDWGAGTYEAAIVATQMTEKFSPHWTLHIGDVYLLGVPEEVKTNCLGQPAPHSEKGVQWPSGSIGSFAFNGNHEMYSRGYGYFDNFLPTLGVPNVSPQRASYVALENKYWRVIGLDTGYGSYSALINSPDTSQQAAVVEWLKNEVNLGDPNDKRGIVLLSHHQFLSAFESKIKYTAEQIAAILPPGRTLLWLWGHEHRLAFYKPGTVDGIPLNVYGRCVGVGGYPVSLGSIPPDAKSAGLLAYDDRYLHTVEGLVPMRKGFNGFLHMTLQKASLSLAYYSLTADPSNPNVYTNDPTLLVTETFQVDGAGSLQQTAFTIVNKNMTVVQYM